MGREFCDMKLALISFTKTGASLCCQLTKNLQKQGYICEGYIPSRFFQETEGREDKGIYGLEESALEWTKRQFFQMDGLIYIGAAGIAVRSVAPFLRDKLTDPGVVAVDERGQYAISLLSGHVGGANELAKAVAKSCGAVPVITTATDINRKMAIDVWAAKRGLWIGDREAAKEVSVRLLEGESVGFFSDFPVKEPLPEEYSWNRAGKANVWVTVKKRPRKEDETGTMLLEVLEEGGQILRLAPRILTVGIGCRKGISSEIIEEKIKEALEEGNLEEHAVARFASIDLKKEEEGIFRVAKKWGVPFVTFSAGKLETVRGTVQESAFVRQVTGTGNVCERAALLGAGEDGALLVEKKAGHGVTVAVAMESLGGL